MVDDEHFIVGDPTHECRVDWSRHSDAQQSSWSSAPLRSAAADADREQQRGVGCVDAVTRSHDAIIVKPQRRSAENAPRCSSFAIGGRTVAASNWRARRPLAGTWAGFRLYGKLDESGSRKAVLMLLLLSGASLVIW